MDIICKAVLDFIQNEKEHSFSVLAGGACRDVYYGLTPKDYDLFVPSKTGKQIEELITSIHKEFPTEGLNLLGTQYDKSSSSGPQKITQVWEFNFQGKKFNVIGIKEPNDGDFADQLVDTFDFGYNMIYDDGVSVTETSKFQDDHYGNRGTLWNIKNIDALTNHMHRFFLFDEKQFVVTKRNKRFYCPNLKLQGEEERKPRIKSKYLVGESTLNSLTEDTWAWTPATTTTTQAGQVFGQVGLHSLDLNPNNPWTTTDLLAVNTVSTSVENEAEDNNW